MSRNCTQSKRQKGSCFTCGELGHMARECKEKGKVHVNNVFDSSHDKVDSQTVVTYGMSDGKTRTDLQLNTLLDTGSPISFLKEDFVQGHISPIDGAMANFRGINNSKLILKGKLKVRITLGVLTKENIMLYIVPDDTMFTPVVLGRDVLKAFNLGLAKLSDASFDEALQEIMSIDVGNSGEDLAETLTIYSGICLKDQLSLKGLFITEYLKPPRPEAPLVKVELKLVLRDPQPFHVTPRKLYTEKDRLKLILDTLLAKGTIRSSKLEFASPIVLVKKKNGELRTCIDYRTLNKALVRDNYPLPLIEDQLDVLRGKKYFSLLDLKDGFHHNSIAEESIKYTSFITPLGQFEYTKMPFGLKTAPSKFQRFVNKVLSELIRSGDIAVYLDDFLVATHTVEHHLQVLRRVFQLLVANKMELRIDKCKFLYEEIDYLGYLVSEKGVSPNGGAVEAVRRFPVPQNVHDVQFYRSMLLFPKVCRNLCDHRQASIRFAWKRLDF